MRPAKRCKVVTHLRSIETRDMTLPRFVLIATALVGLLVPALAADAVYPPGSRVGLVLLEGLKRSNSFRGFEDPDAGLKVAVAEVPANVFATIDAAMKDPASAPPDGL